ncbi:MULTISPECIES: thiamine phosphate synthase [unclassified Aureimonas]|uniref:thiamine phosphate synthase n=1 Tax=unclassified Aureimonas TaxID=2615206 RepID=UPI0006FCC266|nr:MULTISPECIES: thiamine phosphate synthase [unclassified Aureimonas]KQT69654.1 thiamine-phosphate pyrophosphorylase [Aureimonas sp. Leaf427]KQT76192.1 thiamine-phosphate pyrophosphorylase [Aureimonas sp. Leaf460]
MPAPDIRLYALVDASLGADRLPTLAGLAARNGATLIQYRDKTAGTRAMVERARAIRAALAGTGVPLLVNDRVDVALAAGAEGVHLGREDMLPGEARALLGPNAIIGITVKNEADAHGAASPCVDYACIGGVFETLSKKNPDAPVGLEGLAHLRALVRTVRPEIPVGAIAGIDLARTPLVLAAGADGVALISALFRAKDVPETARAFRAAVDAALMERGR